MLERHSTGEGRFDRTSCTSIVKKTQCRYTLKNSRPHPRGRLWPRYVKEVHFLVLESRVASTGQARGVFEYGVNESSLVFDLDADRRVRYVECMVLQTTWQPDRDLH